MQPNFIEVGNTVLNVSLVAAIFFDGERAQVELSNGRSHVFHGQDAADLRRYFRPVTPEPKKDV